MTSMINALANSGPPELKSPIAPKESPPFQEGSSNRFKDSLEKAIREEKPAEPEKKPETERKQENVDGKQGNVSHKKTDVSEGKKTTSEKGSNPLKKGKVKVPSKISTDVSISEKTQSTEEEQGNLKASAEDIKTDHQKKSSEKKSRFSVKKNKTDSNNDNDNSRLTEANKETVVQIPVEDQEKTKTLSHKGDGKTEEETSGKDVIVPFVKQSDNSGVQTVLTSQNQIKVSVDKKAIAAGRQKKGKENPVLTVVDARSKKDENRDTVQGVAKSAATVEANDQTVKDNNTIVLGEQNTDRVAGDETKSFQSSFAENREAVLARELHESGNDQIVKKASFVLKDSNQGEIKLILKPEALGQVKIHLDMNENHLVGKIIVENNRVGQIFENNLNNLTKAFEEAGISSSSIEVSVGNGNGQPGDNRSFQENQPFYSDRLKTLDQAVPTMEAAFSGQSLQHIDLVV